jgi:transcriptional regulator with XRE-family HTH domain
MGVSRNTGQRYGSRLSGRISEVWRRSLGAELRRRRQALGVSQAALGAPLTRAFVSAVERGQAVPSLPALRLMVDHLGIPLSEFFDGVEAAVVEHYLTGAYDGDHEPTDDAVAPQGGR